MNTVIDVNGVVKIYEGRSAVLDGVTFSVQEREFVAIYGRSGCGKTTLLNMLGGLDRPTSGRIVIDGENIIGLSEDELASMRLRKIGFVFQDYNLLSDLTVRENVGLPLRFSKRTERGQVDELLKKFDIHGISEEKANKISGGEAQRTAIARAMINEPRIILADEPTGNLDVENTEKVIEIFNLVRRDFNTTIVLATHDRDLATYASSKVLISEGKAIVESGGT